MSLSSGSRLGAYEIVAPLGAGGMGEVYRARDTRIDRTVAIKVLPSALADDAERKKRFEREAKSISSLNHPHICTLYEFDSHEGTDFLVMEHLEGETLAERIAHKGALPFVEALHYAVQIAEALASAHLHGVTHRDLKPGNVMLTERGAILLDFGLARLRQGSGGAGPDLSALTEAKPLTQEGAILGTFQYMAPEQLEGGEADSRTDVFAFGAVVHEMVTGKKAFEGKSQASLIGAILEREPAPVSSLRPIVPRGLDRIVKKCLAKDPAERYHSAHDLADELRWLGEAESESAVPERRSGSGKYLGVAAGALVGVLIAGAALWGFLPEPPAAHVVRFSLPVDGFAGTAAPNVVAVAPDGTRFAFVADNRIHVRELGELQARPLSGTEGNPENLAFSPDGRWIAFWASGQLKKVALGGGAPLRLCDVDPVFGIVWGEDDVILLGSRTGIQQVSSSGGAPELVLRTSEPVWSPHRLPDDRSYVFSIGDGPNPDNYRIGVWSRGEDNPRVIFEGADVVRYLASGHLLFHVASNDLLAAPFDVSLRELAGTPVPVIEGSDWQFDVSPNGTLLYVPMANPSATRLVWVDRKGIVSPAVDERRGFRRPRLSPDGRRVAVEGFENNQWDIWIYELERGTRTRLTADAGVENDPVWTPDGESIVFGSIRGLSSKSSDGTGETTIVVSGDIPKDPHSLSPDGKYLAYYERPSENRDIWVLELEGEGKPEPFVVTEFNDRSPSFSPDGRFLAYVSDASGRDEIYVQPYPGPGPRTVVSTGGGREPVWSRDGKELFYRNGDRMMVVAVETESRFRAGVPEALFEAKFQTEAAAGSGSQTYDVSPDGQKFLMVELGDVSRELHVVLNWIEELKARVPGTR